MKALKGDRDAIKEMVKYNKADVILLEAIYQKIRPYIKNHPHIGAYQNKDKNCSCRACGSLDLKRNGIRLTAGGLRRQEYQCKDCGSYSSFTIPKE